MASTASINFSIFVRERIGSAEDIRTACTLAAGIAISRVLSVPMGTLDDLQNYYSANHIWRTQSLIDRINADIAVDVQKVESIARAFWMMRALAQQSDPNGIILAKGPGTFMEKFFNVYFYLSEDDLTFLNKNSEVMAVVVNRIGPVIAEAVAATSN